MLINMYYKLASDKDDTLKAPTDNFGGDLDDGFDNNGKSLIINYFFFSTKICNYYILSPISWS